MIKVIYLILKIAQAPNNNCFAFDPNIFAGKIKNCIKFKF